MPYTNTVPIEHVKLSDFGTPKVKGIMVSFIASFENDPEWPVERIMESYGLTKGQIYAAWSYYHDHKAEIDRQTAEAEAHVRQHIAEQKAARAGQEV